MRPTQHGAAPREREATPQTSHHIGNGCEGFSDISHTVVITTRPRSARTTILVGGCLKGRLVGPDAVNGYTFL